VVTIYVNDIP